MFKVYFSFTKILKKNICTILWAKWNLEQRNKGKEIRLILKVFQNFVPKSFIFWNWCDIFLCFNDAWVQKLRVSNSELLYPCIIKTAVKTDTAVNTHVFNLAAAARWVRFQKSRDALPAGLCWWIWHIFCFTVPFARVRTASLMASLTLQQTGNLSRVYHTSHPMTAGIDSSLTMTLNWINIRRWMDKLRNPDFNKLLFILDKLLCPSVGQWSQ